MARIAFRAVGGVMGAQIRANKRKTRRTNPPKISQASSRDVPGGRETKSGGQQNSDALERPDIIGHQQFADSLDGDRLDLRRR